MRAELCGGPPTTTIGSEEGQVMLLSQMTAQQVASCRGPWFQNL